MQAFVTQYYVEPENIPTEIVQEEDIFLFLMLTGQLGPVLYVEFWSRRMQLRQ
jgi:hypothetical protein